MVNDGGKFMNTTSRTCLYFIPVITIRRKARAESNVATLSLSETLRGLIVANY